MLKITQISLSTLDNIRLTPYNTRTIRREVEQLAARRAHNPEAAGSSPALAILNLSEISERFFI